MSEQMRYFKLVEFEKAIPCTFKPKPDITAWELAQILIHIHGKPIYESDWEELGSATRHLERL